MALNFIGKVNSIIPTTTTYSANGVVVAVSLNALQSGSFINFSMPTTVGGNAGSLTFTLPLTANSSGLRYYFLCNAVGTINMAIQTTGAENTIYINYPVYVANANALCHIITGNFGAMAVGEHIELYCNGMNWLVNSFSNVGVWSVA